jgi:hypothetical protein
VDKPWINHGFSVWQERAIIPLRGNNHGPPFLKEELSSTPTRSVSGRGGDNTGGSGLLVRKQHTARILTGSGRRSYQPPVGRH